MAFSRLAQSVNSFCLAYAPDSTITSNECNSLIMLSAGTKYLQYYEEVYAACLLCSILNTIIVVSYWKGGERVLIYLLYWETFMAAVELGKN